MLLKPGWSRSWQMQEVRRIITSMSSSRSLRPHLHTRPYIWTGRKGGYSRRAMQGGVIPSKAVSEQIAIPEGWYHTRLYQNRLLFQRGDTIQGCIRTDCYSRGVIPEHWENMAHYFIYNFISQFSIAQLTASTLCTRTQLTVAINMTM